MRRTVYEDENIVAESVDEPGPGGAHHQFFIQKKSTGSLLCEIRFQEGPIKEVGCNGITNECLLAIVLDTLRSFQSGEFSCRENALAITKLEEGEMWLQKRTSDRKKRGVEGYSKK